MRTASTARRPSRGTRERPTAPASRRQSAGARRRLALCNATPPAAGAMPAGCSAAGAGARAGQVARDPSNAEMSVERSQGGDGGGKDRLATVHARSTRRATLRRRPAVARAASARRRRGDQRHDCSRSSTAVRPAFRRQRLQIGPDEPQGGDAHANAAAAAAAAITWRHAATQEMMRSTSTEGVAEVSAAVSSPTYRARHARLARDARAGRLFGDRRAGDRRTRCRAILVNRDSGARPAAGAAPPPIKKKGRAGTVLASAINRWTNGARRGVLRYQVRAAFSSRTLVQTPSGARGGSRHRRGRPHWAFPLSRAPRAGGDPAR